MGNASEARFRQLYTQNCHAFDEPSCGVRVQMTKTTTTTTTNSHLVSALRASIACAVISTVTTKSDPGFKTEACDSQGFFFQNVSLQEDPVLFEPWEGSREQKRNPGTIP